MSQEIIVIVEPPPEIEVVLSDTEPRPEIDVVISDSEVPTEIDVTVSETTPQSEIDVVVSETGLAGPVGPPGPAGPQGQQGPAGPVGSIDNLYYEEFNVATPSTTWLFAHNQNTYAIHVETSDTSGQLIEGDVEYVDANNIQVNWYYPTAGIARLFR